MAKQYKVLVNNGKAEEIVEVTQGAGDAGKPVRIKTVAGARYQLSDTAVEQEQARKAPRQVRARRVGKDLHVLFDTSDQADLILENYYEVMPEGYNALIGQGEDGLFHEYVAADVESKEAIGTLLEQGGEDLALDLGAEVASGAAVAAVAPLIGPGTLAAGAGAAAAAGGGGGGGGGGADPAATARASIQKFAEDNSTGLANATGTAPSTSTYSDAGVTGC